jgi:uncharacterized membrane protein
MSELMVITFDGEEQAGQALQRIRQVEQAGQLMLNDTAVVVKDTGGAVRTRNEVSSATETGAVVGGVVGGLLSFFLPLAGVAVGAAAGAAAGALMGKGIDGGFVREVQAELPPGSSALFLLARQADVRSVAAALEPFRGKLHQTTLDSDAEEALRRALQ